MTLTIEVPDDNELSLNEVCKFIRRDRKVVNRWIGEGRFPKPVRIGKVDVWMARSIGLWMASVESQCISLADSDEVENSENDDAEESPVKKKPLPKIAGE
jgi:predicted DNA-binding transcriptional regulator AlpA